MTEMTPKTFRPQMWCKGVSDKNDEYHRRKSDLEVNIYTVCNLYFAPNIQEKYTNGHYIDTACFHKNQGLKPAKIFVSQEHLLNVQF